MQPDHHMLQMRTSQPENYILQIRTSQPEHHMLQIRTSQPEHHMLQIRTSQPEHHMLQIRTNQLEHHMLQMRTKETGLTGTSSLFGNKNKDVRIPFSSTFVNNTLSINVVHLSEDTLKELPRGGCPRPTMSMLLLMTVSCNMMFCILYCK